MSKTDKTKKTKAAASAKVTKLKTPAPARRRSPKVRLQWTTGGRSVAVAGSFNAWQPEPAKPVLNKWVKELAVAPGRYEYLFVVDGQWLTDPQAPETVPNPFGGRNSVLVVNN